MAKRTLRQHRVLKDMTQEELARECDISVKTISMYENDIEALRGASYKTLLKISNALGIKVDNIYFN